jgi:hypothetical protein
MNKAKLNFIIDTVAFVAFALLASTGVLIRYVLPAGSGHFANLWDLDRHDWGHVHFWIAVALMGTLALHLLLHWTWIVSMVKGRPTEASGYRLGLAVVGLLALIGLAGAPFVVEVEHSGEPPHKLRSSEASEKTEPRIDGSMTLRQIEQMTGVSAQTLVRELHLPSDVSLDENLGRLRRQYGFKMEDVRNVLRKQHNDNVLDEVRN